MNVTFTKNDDGVRARLAVEVVENDYKPLVDKRLKEIARERVVPGFRKGHVPASVMQRMFGDAVASDVINDEVYKATAEYLRDNNVNILGQPLPVQVEALDFKKQKDYTFQYDLILAPAVDVALSKDIHVPYYNITVSDEMVDEQDKAMRRRFGTQEPGPETTPDCLVKGPLMQLNENGEINDNEGAIQVTSAMLAPFTFKSDAEKEKFMNKKVGDKVVFNPWNTCNGDPAEMSSMLQIDRSIAADVHSDFEMVLSEIIVVKDAELGEELYTNAFGPDSVHNEEEYRKAIAEGIGRSLAVNSEMLFRRDAQKALLDAFGTHMHFADDLLKRWLVMSNDDLTEEKVEADYESMLPSLKWEIISGRLAEAADIKVTNDDMKKAAMERARQQFAQYGMTNLADEILERYAGQMLEDKENARRIYEQVADARLFAAIKEGVTIDTKDVTLDEFRNIVDSEQ